MIVTLMKSQGMSRRRQRHEDGELVFPVRLQRLECDGMKKEITR